MSDEPGCRPAALTGLGVLLGIACFAAVRGLHSAGVGETPGWLAWFAMLSAAGFLLGSLSATRTAWIAAAIVVLLQPVGVYVTHLCSAPTETRTRSTGGMAGVCIISGFLLCGSPLVIAATAFGMHVRRRRAPARDPEPPRPLDP